MALPYGGWRARFCCPHHCHWGDLDYFIAECQGYSRYPDCARRWRNWCLGRFARSITSQVVVEAKAAGRAPSREVAGTARGGQLGPMGFTALDALSQLPLSCIYRKLFQEVVACTAKRSPSCFCSSPISTTGCVSPRRR